MSIHFAQIGWDRPTAKTSWRFALYNGSFGFQIESREIHFLDTKKPSFKDPILISAFWMSIAKQVFLLVIFEFLLESLFELGHGSECPRLVGAHIWREHPLLLGRVY